jgi:hypothetical protein
MTERSFAQRVAERVIRSGCRSLTGDVGRERVQEWTAELPAILRDPDVKSAAVRTARMLRYAAGAYRAGRRLRSSAGGSRPASGGWASRSRRRPVKWPTFPDGVFAGIAAIVVWVVVILLVRTHPPTGYWNVMGIAGGFVSEALGLFAVVRFIRWARRQSKGSRRP